MTNMAATVWRSGTIQDGFYYDVLELPDGRNVPLRVRSLVGLIPLFAVHVLEPSVFRSYPISPRACAGFLTTSRSWHDWSRAGQNSVAVSGSSCRCCAVSA